MHDGIHAVKLGAVREDNGAELGAVDVASSAGDRRAKLAEDFVVSGLTRLDQLVRQGVRVEDGENEFAEHGGDGAFAAGDAAGEAESKHVFPGYRARAVDCVAENLGEARRRRAAFT